MTDLVDQSPASEEGVENTRSIAGTKTRRRVLGDQHVDRATQNMTAFDQPFQAFITEGAWGSVWSRDDLTLRERSMITIALLAALGQHEELAMHIRATRNTGASQEDIRAALMHVAVYAGVPAANTAIKIAKQVFIEDAARPDALNKAASGAPASEPSEKDAAE